MRIVEKVGAGPVGLGECEVAPGLQGFSRVEVELDAGENGPYALRATVEPNGRGQLAVTALTATQVDGGPPLQRGELAKISVDPIVRYVASATVMRVEGSKIGHPGPRDGDFWERVEANGLSESDLPDLARAYRWIRLQEGRPTAILAEELGVSPATVKRWLARAVEAGHLDQSERTK